MAEQLDANVTTLRPKAKDATNALRQRRHRERKSRPTVTKSAESARRDLESGRKISDLKNRNDIKGDVTVARRGGHTANLAAYVVAVGLASVAALFSIKGMVQLFLGTPLLIVAHNGAHGDRGAAQGP